LCIDKNSDEQHVQDSANTRANFDEQATQDKQAAYEYAGLSKTEEGMTAGTLM